VGATSAGPPSCRARSVRARANISALLQHNTCAASCCFKPLHRQSHESPDIISAWRVRTGVCRFGCSQWPWVKPGCCAFTLSDVAHASPRMSLTYSARPSACAWSSFLLQTLIAVSSLADPSYLSTACPFARCVFLASRFINLFACLSLPTHSCDLPFWYTFALSLFRQL
jgi:hypothetical protein